MKLRELVGAHRELIRRLDDLEEKTAALAMNHDTVSRNTRARLKQVFDALRACPAVSIRTSLFGLRRRSR